MSALAFMSALMPLAALASHSHAGEAGNSTAWDDGTCVIDSNPSDIVYLLRCARLQCGLGRGDDDADARFARC